MTLAGLDGMGNSVANRFGSGFFGPSNPDILGSTGGQPSIALGTAQLPPYPPSATFTINGGVYTDAQAYICCGRRGSSTAFQPMYRRGQPVRPIYRCRIAEKHGSVSAISATFNPSPQGGTSAAFSIISPTKLCTIYIKL